MSPALIIVRRKIRRREKEREGESGGKDAKRVGRGDDGRMRERKMNSRPIDGGGYLVLSSNFSISPFLPSMILIPETS